MLLNNRIVGFSNAVERILFSGIKKYLSSKKFVGRKEETLKVINSLSGPDTSIGPFLNVAKVKFLSFSKTFGGLTLINENVACDIVRKILPSEEEDKCVVVEGNADLGLITVNLIKLGVHHIISHVDPCLEPVCLAQLVSKYPNKITISYGDVYLQSEEVILSAFDFYQKQGTPVIVLGIVKSFHFIIALTLCIHKFDLWEYDVTFYLVLPKENIKFLTQFSNEMKRHIQGLFNIFFEVEEIANYPSSAFLQNENSVSKVTLLKITKNPKCFNIIPKNELDDFFVFLHIIGTRKRMPLIKVLENWMPKCGPYLISKGISPINTSEDLLIQESIVLFEILKDFEGFEYFKITSTEIYKELLSKF